VKPESNADASEPANQKLRAAEDPVGASGFEMFGNGNEKGEKCLARNQLILLVEQRDPNPWPPHCPTEMKTARNASPEIIDSIGGAEGGSNPWPPHCERHSALLLTN